MKNKNEIGFIYKVENTVTHEIYIGATTTSIEIRIKDHFDKANRKDGHKFQEAIATYGPDAFHWEQVDTANSINELAEKEKQYVVKYNSKEKGYNIDSGGGFKKDVFKYNKKGNLVTKFDCLEAAAKTVGATKQSISSACLSVNKLYKGFYWSYKLQEPFIPGTDKRLKKVFQYTLKGEFVNEFNSVAEASRKTGVSKTSIAKVCRREYSKSNGFVWSYCRLKTGGDEI
jgi:hypothetical protein